MVVGGLPKQMGRDFRRSWIHFVFFLISNKYFFKKQPLLREKLIILKRYDTIKTSQGNVFKFSGVFHIGKYVKIKI